MVEGVTEGVMVAEEEKEEEEEEEEEESSSVSVSVEEAPSFVFLLDAENLRCNNIASTAPCGRVRCVGLLTNK